MDIAEKRLPQDGAIALKSGDKRMDLRVNTVPTVYGEKVVLRVLDRSAIPADLARSLGLDERQAADLVESIQKSHGLMLVTGPTGSGKSTTLYACLSLLNKPDRNICTVEDPVEYKFKGLNQVQVKSQIGFNFASALRSFLRQDPDIIMVGEVRDQETAEICLRAALDRPLRAFVAAHQRRLVRRDAVGRYRPGAVSAGFHAARAGSAAAAATALSAVQTAV